MAQLHRFAAKTAVLYSLSGIALVALWAGGSARLHGLLINTALLSAGTMAVALPLGGLLGVLLAKTNLPGRRVATGLLIGLLFIPLYLYTAAWQAALGYNGWITRLISSEQYAEPVLRGWFGAIWVHGIAATPWAALFTAASLRSVERQLEEESLLDARPWQVLTRISLRRGSAGLLTAAIWICLVCGTETAVSDLFVIRTFAEEVYTEANLGSLTAVSVPGTAPTSSESEQLGSGLLRTDLAIGVAILFLLLCVGVRTAARWLPLAADLEPSDTWRWRPARGRAALAAVFFALVGLLTAAPVASLAWKAGIRVRQIDGELVRDWSVGKLAGMLGDSFSAHGQEWLYSLSTGLVAVALALVLAACLAWIGRHCPRWASVIVLVLAAIAATPGPLVGVWTIQLFNQPRDSPLSFLGWLYGETFAAHVFVQFVRIAPLLTLLMWTQLATVPQTLLDTAASEGAGVWRQLWRVGLPVRWPSVAVAAAIGLVLAMGELAATLLVELPGYMPLSVRFFGLLHYGADDKVAALSLSIMLMVLAAATAVSLLVARGARVR